MKIKAKHSGYPEHVIRRATVWAAKQIGLESKHRKTLTIEVGYCRTTWRRDGDTWRGLYRHRERLVRVNLGRDICYPTPAGHNKSEADRYANDEWEVFVKLLAHELEHARAYAVAQTWEERARLNHEPRVRAIDWRTLLAFRERRDELLAEWCRVPVKRPVVTRPKPSVVERRAERAAVLLSQWERRMRLAKTKVAKYRRRVAYYEKAAAGGKAANPSGQKS